MAILRQPSGVIGLLIILILLVMSVYAIIAYPAQRAQTLWTAQDERGVWHANPEKAAQDNLRDNDIETAGWKVLRFSSAQIQEHAADYCVETVAENVNALGGLDEGRTIPRKINLHDTAYQPSLFDAAQE